MELNEFAKIVDRMIIEHDYPGFEAKSLKLGLPEEVLRSPAKMFSHALGHESVYVKLAALRWFQERPGVAKTYVNAIAGLLSSDDEWVRLEAAKTIERVSMPPDDVIVKLAPLLADSSIEVKKGAAKALGKICSRKSNQTPTIVAALQEATLDKDAGVRFKAQKALRLMGEYAD